MRRDFVSIWILGVLILGCRITGSGSGTGGNGGGALGGSSVPPGETGTTVSGLNTNPLSSLCQTLGGAIYVSSDGGKPLVSATGASFEVLDGTENDLSGVYCDQSSTSATDVWFVGAGGNVVYYDGTALSTQATGSTVDLHGIFGTDVANLYAAGDSGTVLHFDGTSWASQTSGVAENLYGVGGPNRAKVYVVGENRTVLKLTGAASWSPVSGLPDSVPTDVQLNAVWGDPVSGEVFVVGHAGVILHGSSDGATWEKQETGTSLQLYAVHGLSNTAVVAVGEKGTILIYNGSTWTREESPDGTTYDLRGVLTLSTNEVLAVGGSTGTARTGTLLIRTSSGWEKLL